MQDAVVETQVQSPEAEAVEKLLAYQRPNTPANLGLCLWTLGLAVWMGFCLAIGSRFLYWPLTIFTFFAGSYISARMLGYKTFRTKLVPDFGPALATSAPVPVVKALTLVLAGPAFIFLLGLGAFELYSLTHASHCLAAAQTFVAGGLLLLLPLPASNGGFFALRLLPSSAHDKQGWCVFLLMGVSLSALCVTRYAFFAAWIGGGLAQLVYTYNYDLAMRALKTSEIWHGPDTEYVLSPEVALRLIRLVQHSTDFYTPEKAVAPAWLVWNQATAPRPRRSEVLWLLTAYLFLLCLACITWFKLIVPAGPFLFLK